MREMASNLCTGCRSCEVACSYHHCHSFGGLSSSITVRCDVETRDIRIHLDPSCDGCVGEEMPLCKLFCARNVPLERLIVDRKSKEQDPR